MSPLLKGIGYSVVLGYLLVSCSRGVTEESVTGGVIGSPKVSLKRPHSLLCQEGWVVVVYDISDLGEIKDVQVQDSQPAGLFDQYALDAFEKLKPAILSKNPGPVKGATYKFVYSVDDSCK